jgi:hypothetical protein
MIYTDNWAWIHIPKTSGVNFRDRVGRQPGVTIARTRSLFKHQILQWWLDNSILNSSQFIFTFVRNPYARIVSLYNHLATNGNNPDLSPFKKFIMDDIDTGIIRSFKGSRVSNKIPMEVFDLCWPQYKFIENDQGIDVRCYKMETELPLVEKYVGHIFTDTRIHEKPHAPWQTYYDSDSRKKVEDFYMEDFKRFNYEY